MIIRDLTDWKRKRIKPGELSALNNVQNETQAGKPVQNGQFYNTSAGLNWKMCWRVKEKLQGGTGNNTNGLRTEPWGSPKEFEKKACVLVCVDVWDGIRGKAWSEGTRKEVAVSFKCNPFSDVNILPWPTLITEHAVLHNTILTTVNNNTYSASIIL